MVIREIIAAILEFVFDFVGAEGLAVGALALVVAILWYTREAADLLVVLARWARIGSVIGAVVLALYVAGAVTGVVEHGIAASLLEQLSGHLH